VFIKQLQIGCGLHPSGSGQGTVADSCVLRNEPLGSTECGEYLDLSRINERIDTGRGELQSASYFHRPTHIACSGDVRKQGGAGRAR
jgi:hypothetical protein